MLEKLFSLFLGWENKKTCPMRTRIIQPQVMGDTTGSTSALESKVTKEVEIESLQPHKCWKKLPDLSEGWRMSAVMKILMMG